MTTSYQVARLIICFLIIIIILEMFCRLSSLLRSKDLFRILKWKRRHTPGMLQSDRVRHSGSRTGKRYVLYRAAPFFGFMLKVTRHILSIEYLSNDGAEMWAHHLFFGKSNPSPSLNIFVNFLISFPVRVLLRTTTKYSYNRHFSRKKTTAGHRLPRRSPQREVVQCSHQADTPANFANQVIGPLIK